MTHLQRVGGEIDIRQAVARIDAWYDEERDRALDALDAERRMRLAAARASCQHRWTKWRQIDMQMVACWVTYYQRDCQVCDLHEQQDGKPITDYPLKVRECPQHY